MIKFTKVAHINVRSLLPKLHRIRDVLYLNNYDVLALSETWLSGDIRDVHLSIDGYKFIHVDRDARGGGVGAYVRNCFDCRIIGSSSVDIEQIWFSIKVNSKYLVFGVVYRPPRQDYNFFLDKLENSLVSNAFISDILICLGDLNIDLLRCSTASSSLQLLLESLSLEQIVTEPTTLTSLLDLIIVSDVLAISSTSVYECDFSDHDLITCTINFERRVAEVPAKFYRDLNKVDSDAFATCLQALPLWRICAIHDVDDKVYLLSDSLLKLFHLFAPVKSARFTRPCMPWITDNIKLLMCLRDKAKRKYKHTCQPAHYNYYKSLRNYTTSAIRREKRAYFDFVVRSCNGGILWKKLRSLNIISSNRLSIPRALLTWRK
ncbi:hypothetical protein MML48_7g00021544 [Holotrichia oblita]|uniref:Uncharacterized protein n=1 Tax=Holotrichia oblita TaxID=644536 RepID=A0ACB9SR68_HOLOL|nr:hypothetical protein MML48_7g00021544 [Holotrichia oblita]